MFVFAKNWRESIVTAGTVVACLTLIWFAAEFFYKGWIQFITAVVFVSITVAILKGMKLGYQMARVLFCGSMVLVVSGVVNPLCYADMLEDNDAYWALLLDTALFVAIGFIAFFSLGEHAKLRNVKL